MSTQIFRLSEKVFTPGEIRRTNKKYTLSCNKFPKKKSNEIEEMNQKLFSIVSDGLGHSNKYTQKSQLKHDQGKLNTSQRFSNTKTELDRKKYRFSSVPDKKPNLRKNSRSGQYEIKFNRKKGTRMNKKRVMLEKLANHEMSKTINEYLDGNQPDISKKENRVHMENIRNMISQFTNNIQKKSKNENSTLKDSKIRPLNRV